MNNKKIIFLIFITFIFTNSFADTYAGKTGLAFLQIGAGGRAVGMGEAFTAVANDASATYWNPAGIAVLDRSEFLFMHNKWFQDISHNYAAFTFSNGSHKFGLSYMSSTISGIERRTSPSSEPLGEFDTHDIMAGLSYARTWNNNLQYGLTLKYIYEKIYLESAYGVAVDLGIIYHTPVKHITIGAVIANIGKTSAFKNEEIKLPTTVKMGLAYELPIRLYGNALIAADILKVLDGAFYTNIGLEYDVKKMIALRFGYLAGYDERTFQGGFGLSFSHYRLDYGYVPFASDLGNSHRISLGIIF